MVDDPKLAKRLEHLRSQDAACCGRDPARLWQTVQGEALEGAVDRYEALADERRLGVLAMLAEVEELCACEIQAALDRSHATVNHHMDRLQEADLVEATRRGRWVYYSLAEGAQRWVP